MNSVKKGYQPPFSITAKMIQLVAEISENIGRLSTEQEQIKAQRLRRINRIRTIHGSLAIEGNLLDASQIAAIIEGKRVIAPIREIQEARNAILAYEKLNHWYFTSEQNLLEAHYVLMKGLLDNAGSYRHSGVGVMDGEKVIHQATQQVKQLIMVLEGEMNRGQLQSALGLKDRNSFRQRYLQPALAAGLIEMSHPEKPSSPSQHYRLTAKGINLKNHHK